MGAVTLCVIYSHIIRISVGLVVFLPWLGAAAALPTCIYDRLLVIRYTRGVQSPREQKWQQSM
jgi:hypothetical protein